MINKSNSKVSMSKIEKLNNLCGSFRLILLAVKTIR